MFLQHPLYDLPTANRQIRTVRAFEAIQIMKDFIAFVAAQVPGILTDELWVIAFSDSPFVVVVKVTSFHLRHSCFLGVEYLFVSLT